jgi:heme-degrading monooxygenase HmoA
VPVITLFEAPGRAADFEAAWRASREAGILLRARSEQAEFAYAELVPDELGPADGLPGRAVGGRYEPCVDDLPQGATGGCVLVNAFEVGDDEVEEFIARWTAVRNTVVPLRGYVGSRLHRAVDPRARFSFINVAPWRDVDSFTAAVASTDFLHASREIYHQAHPSLYEVAARGG